MDVVKIEELIKVLEASRTEELSVRKGEVNIRIRKALQNASSVAKRVGKKPKMSAVQAANADEECMILAPMVGIFYGADGAMKAGAKVGPGQVVGAIESMKLLNDVVSDVAGEVTEVLVEDGMPVEYGQPLCKLTPF